MKNIVCVILDSRVNDGGTKCRPLLIKPKGQKDHFHVGDEMIRVYASQGDVYIMDGVCIVNTTFILDTCWYYMSLTIVLVME